jgi:hypothetical protein
MKVELVTNSLVKQKEEILYTTEPTNIAKFLRHSIEPTDVRAWVMRNGNNPQIPRDEENKILGYLGNIDLTGEPLLKNSESTRFLFSTGKSAVGIHLEIIAPENTKPQDRVRRATGIIIHRFGSTANELFINSLMNGAGE